MPASPPDLSLASTYVPALLLIAKAVAVASLAWQLDPVDGHLSHAQVALTLAYGLWLYHDNAIGLALRQAIPCGPTCSVFFDTSALAADMMLFGVVLPRLSHSLADPHLEILAHPSLLLEQPPAVVLGPNASTTVPALEQPPESWWAFRVLSIAWAIGSSYYIALLERKRSTPSIAINCTTIFVILFSCLAVPAPTKYTKDPASNALFACLAYSILCITDVYLVRLSAGAVVPEVLPETQRLMLFK